MDLDNPTLPLQRNLIQCNVAMLSANHYRSVQFFVETFNHTVCVAQDPVVGNAVCVPVLWGVYIYICVCVCACAMCAHVCVCLCVCNDNFDNSN